jgi:hypothetical protein
MEGRETVALSVRRNRADDIGATEKIAVAEEKQDAGARARDE